MTDSDITTRWYQLGARGPLDLGAARLTGLPDTVARMATLAKEIEVLAAEVARGVTSLQTKRAEYEARVRWLNDVIGLVNTEAPGAWRGDEIPGATPSQAEIDEAHGAMS